MHFDRSDLQQLTPDYISKLPPERVAILCEQLRQDLIHARDRLNQNPSNSSRPPSTRAPWERQSDEKIDDPDDKPQSGTSGKQSIEPTQEDATVTGESNHPQQQTQETASQKRKPGRQPGSQGFGRTQKLIVTHEVVHKPSCCKGCSKSFESEVKFHATCGYYSIDLVLPEESGIIGISGTYTKHIFGKIACCCGYETEAMPYHAEQEGCWSVEMGEWRLIGPMLASFIVFAKLRLHLTISKTRELLRYWLGISLSKGSINKVLLEAGRATSCLQPELIAALRTSGLLHIDETSWKEHKITRWLWVAVGDQVVYFTVGARSLEVAQSIIGDFSGVLMTDGYLTYRSLANRIRCWAHLDRKAKALAESYDKSASLFGLRMVRALQSMQDSIYKMREMSQEHRKEEATLADKTRIEVLAECIKQVDARNEKARAFAGEILNDIQAIFRILKEPDLPLTNNRAEQAIRPLVILRKISYGSKTDEGSRALTLLASVTTTVFIRGQHVWNFLADLINKRRTGHLPPSLPPPIILST
jgi:IS1 family transposase